MSIFPGIFALLLAAAAQPSQDQGQLDAAPITKIPPSYPIACRPAAGERAAPQTVVVMFDINKNGSTQNVRVRESTDKCFEEAAVTAVRAWQYEPPLVNGRAVALPDREATFTFVFEEPTYIDEIDARPIKRLPPGYPDRCQRRAAKLEEVILEFDVSTEGVPENIQIVESTNSCFNEAAERAVAQWRYRPKMVSGEPVVRKNVTTLITFELVGGYTRSARNEVLRERAIYAKFKHVERLIKKGDYEKALAQLAKIEAEYGDAFTRSQRSDFLRLRAGARIETGDYAGALTDLRWAQRMGLSGPAYQAVSEMIVQLEAIVAAQKAEAGGDAEDSEAQAEAEVGKSETEAMSNEVEE